MASIKQTGKTVGPKTTKNPYPAPAADNPLLMVRFLKSCGYRVVGKPQKFTLGWVKFEVVDQKTGENAGFRWVRPKIGGGFTAIRRDPAPEP